MDFLIINPCMHAKQKHLSCNNLTKQKIIESQYTYVLDLEKYLACKKATQKIVA